MTLLHHGTTLIPSHWELSMANYPIKWAHDPVMESYHKISVVLFKQSRRKDECVSLDELIKECDQKLIEIFITVNEKIILGVCST